MISKKVIFEHANLTVSIEGNDADWQQVTKDKWLLCYGAPTAPPKLKFDDGGWSVEAAGEVLNGGSRDFPVSRLLVQGTEPGPFRVVEGFIEVSAMITDSAESFLGTSLKPASPRMWLAAEGVVMEVKASFALPGLISNGPVPALFRWRGGKDWEWRLLDQWPRKGSDNPLSTSNKATTLREHYVVLLGQFANDLSFLTMPATGPGTDPALRLLGEEEALGEPSVPVGEAAFTPFRKDPAGAKPWWRARLVSTHIHMGGGVRRATGKQPQRGVLTDEMALETLELRPQEMQFRVAPDGTRQYVFVEDARGRDLGEGDPELVVALFSDGDTVGAEIQSPAGRVVAPGLVVLPPGPSRPVEAPLQLWLRENEGFAQLEPAGDRPTPAWPASAVEKETRDVKLSAWLDSEKHQNVPFADLSVLLDNCRRVELVLGMKAGEPKSAHLRIWGPAVRLTLGRHACVGADQLDAMRPPYEDPLGATPVFHPLVLISETVASQRAPSPFKAALRVEDNGELQVRFEAGTAVTRWRHLPRHPAAGPAEWALNDPAAASGLSALRGVIPFVVPPGAFEVIPRCGFVEVKTGTAGVPEAFHGQVVALVAEEEKQCEVELRPGAEVVLRRRRAVVALDFHWQRSVPQVEGQGAGQKVAVEQTHVQDRILGEVTVTAADMFESSLNTKVTALLSAAHALRSEQIVDTLTLHAIKAGDTVLVTLAVWREQLQQGAGPITRWALGTADGKPGPCLAGFILEPLGLTLEGDQGVLTLGLRASAEGIDPLLPFAGPGILHLPLLADAGNYRVNAGSVEGRIVFSGPAFLAVIQPASWKPKCLAAVESKKVSFRTVGGEPQLELSELRYWFESEGEIFSLQSAQTLALTALGGAFLTLSEFDAPTPGALRQRAGGGFVFLIEQRLPSLTLRETLLDLAVPDDAKADAVQSPKLWLRDAAADAEPVAVPLRVGDGWEFARAGFIAYGASGTSALGGNLPVAVEALTRLFLRLERSREVEATPDATYWRIDGGMIGWTAEKVFGLSPADAQKPQVTLRCAGGGAQSPAWYLTLNGRVTPVQQVQGLGTQKRSLASKLTFWDGSVPVKETGGNLEIDWARATEGTVLIPALYSGELSWRTNGDGVMRNWNAFITARLSQDGAGAALGVSAVFSVEPIARDAASGLAFRRPSMKFELWDFPSATASAEQQALVVAVNFKASANAGRVTPREDDPGLDATARWTGFYFGPAAQLAATTEAAGAFPGGAWQSLPAAAIQGVAFFGKPSANTPRSVGYTLSRAADGGTIWLRCPVLTVTEERADPAATQPCVWIWNEDRLQKLWIDDTPAKPGAADPPDARRAALATLGRQVLAFSRWHKGAILEIPDDDNPAKPPRWQLIDSPLLNRSLDLDLLTHTNDPTGKPRFGERSRSLAEFRGTGGGRAFVLGAPIHVSLLNKAAQGERPGRLTQFGSRALMAPHVQAAVQVDFPASGGPTGPVRDYLLSLRRSVPFLLDGVDDLCHRQPAAPLLLCAAPGPAATAGTLPHRPQLAHLGLSSPRPGEVVTWAVAATLNTETHFLLSDSLLFAASTPLGDNVEPDVTLDIAPVTLPSHTPFRDHREALRLSWRKFHQTLLEATPEMPALALHSPEINKEAAYGEPVWVHAATTGTLAPEDNVRLLLVITRANNAVDPVTLRVEIAATGATLERSGEAFALLLASSAPNDVAGLAGQNLRLTLSATEPRLVTGKWNAAICRVAIDPPGPVDPLRVITTAQAAHLLARKVAGEEVSIGRSAVSRAAKPLPALIGLIRRKADTERRLIAFGPDNRSWEPLVDGARIRWFTRGEFVDTVPAGTAADWRYDLTTLHSDGSAQTVTGAFTPPLPSS